MSPHSAEPVPDEDDEGNLQEYISIVIVVTVNDHDGPILKSVDKSLRRKGKSLSGFWKAYESPFESDDSNSNPATIVCFMQGNWVYQFVCSPDLIESFARERSLLYQVELAQQSVLALKDLNLLSTLLQNEKRFSSRHEIYLQYRAADLRPITELLSR